MTPRSPHRRLGGGTALVLSAIALLGGTGCTSHHCGDAGVECSTDAPALQAVVTPIREPSQRACRRLMQAQRQASPDQDRVTCAQGRGHVWFRAIVRNNSPDSAQPQCQVRAYDGTGLVFKDRLDVGLVKPPFGPIVAGGHWYSFEGFFADQSGTTVVAYEANCQPLSPQAG